MALFEYAGHCYAQVDALLAFQNQYPIIGETNYTAHVSSSISGAGVVTYSLLTRSITNNTLSSRTGTIQLLTCPKADALNSQDVLESFGWGFGVVILMWSFGFAIGAAIEAIKKI